MPGSLGTGAIANSGTLVFNRNDAALNLTQVVSGTGMVNQVGSGTTTLSSANTYSGNTTISGGTLMVDNTLAMQNSMLNHNSGRLDRLSFGTDHDSRNFWRLVRQS